MKKQLGFIFTLLNLLSLHAAKQENSYELKVVTDKDTQAMQKFERKFKHIVEPHAQVIIQHGKNGNCLDFFKSLGTPYFYAAVVKRLQQPNAQAKPEQAAKKNKGPKIAASGCCVLRDLKTIHGAKTQAWYVCELKVHRKHEKNSMPLKIFASTALKRMLQCRKAYTISFNNAAEVSKGAELFKNHVPFVKPTEKTINLYYLNAQQIQQHLSRITEIMRKNNYLGKTEELGFVSTAGQKDYEVAGQAGDRKNLTVLHLKPNGPIKTVDLDAKDAIYMLCAINNTVLDGDLQQVVGAPTTTAQLLSFGMDHIDFNQLTSDQI